MDRHTDRGTNIQTEGQKYRQRDRQNEVSYEGVVWEQQTETA